MSSAGLKRVVAATADPPNPNVAGHGLDRFRARRDSKRLWACAKPKHGGLMKRFARWVQSKRPLVLMKVAMTLDGRIAPPPARARVARTLLDHVRSGAGRCPAIALAGGCCDDRRGHRAGRRSHADGSQRTAETASVTARSSGFRAAQCRWIPKEVVQGAPSTHLVTPDGFFKG